MNEAPWRVGEHYSIHVYQRDRAVATFHQGVDAARAVAAVNNHDRLSLLEESVRVLAEQWQRSRSGRTRQLGDELAARINAHRHSAFGA